MGREGLMSFAPRDGETYVDEAILLLEGAMLEHRADPAGLWHNGVKRASEMLEWLSEKSLRPAGAPFHLLAAAGYQLAGYPAMALGHLRRVPDEEPMSDLLRELLRADFPATLDATIGFWRRMNNLSSRSDTQQTDLSSLTYQHVVMCIGTVCVYLRTGRSDTLDRALTKLDKLASGMVYSRDAYSRLLATLTAGVCRRFVRDCYWPYIERLCEGTSAGASAALRQFARSAYVNRRALVWPAQAAGIERLRELDSFVLCTPTGSGKTTVATLAIVQGLFAARPAANNGTMVSSQGNLLLYLVPSRALAAEVEARLSEDLRGIAPQPVIVTGLYGGIDWGPTDAWIQSDSPTIVVCTFEKADALLRYLGVLFLHRVRLVVIDEAHMVEQDSSRADSIIDGTSRSLRLEQLGTRLLRARAENDYRIIALSAVAARAGPALARWIAGDADASPTTSTHRTTRQLIGKLEVSPAGRFTIWYDLMDGRSLKFDDERNNDSPYVRDPFPPVPGGVNAHVGPEVRMRAPTLWAALHLAAVRPDGSKPTVLISLTQGVDTFASACADLLDGWPQDQLPNYSEVIETNTEWNLCLASAADYFTVDSVEYRLLKHGIVVHHGKMPSLLARRLKLMIDQGLARITIATSTLSEGVNIPVSYLLMPSVFRGPKEITLQEFANLVGRAGRPGVATDGSALVVLPELVEPHGGGRQRSQYQKFVLSMELATSSAFHGEVDDRGSSPLALLLNSLQHAWEDLSGDGTWEAFANWLEQTAVVNNPDDTNSTIQMLDSLDAFLIAAIQEIEELRQGEIGPQQLEADLIAIWRKTYAFAAAHDEDRLAKTWLARGRAIIAIYPDAAQRRRIYKSSLPPRSATSLINMSEELRGILQSASGYSRWTTDQRLAFINSVFEALSRVPAFRISTKLGKKKHFEDWRMILRWWLAKPTLLKQPNARDVTKWYDYVAANFVYRGTWGLGSLLGLLLDVSPAGVAISAIEMDDWPRSGLPWIAFWLKELITWGTLEPVAAFLLARGNAVDRPHAEADAVAYYASIPPDLSENDVLDPRRIREWIGASRPRANAPIVKEEIAMAVQLTQPTERFRNVRLTVMPIESDDGLIWVDAAGYPVAHSSIPAPWPERPMLFEFELDASIARVTGSAYRRYA